jgi:hypothetical protein
MATDENTKFPQTDLTRRNMLKGAGALAAAAGLSAVEPISAQAQANCEPPVNPYGGGPSKGLQFPPYYQPTNLMFVGGRVLRCPLPRRQALAAIVFAG